MAIIFFYKSIANPCHVLAADFRKSARTKWYSALGACYVLCRDIGSGGVNVDINVTMKERDAKVNDVARQA